MIRYLSMFLPIDIEGKTETYLSLQRKTPDHPALVALQESGNRNAYFKVIALGNGTYASPWQIISEGLGSPQTAPQFQAWEDLVKAYHAQDKQAWNEAVFVLAKPRDLKPDGDEFPLLDAVLNTNFWLATHVICITIGYGWCVLVSLIAHLELWRKKSLVSAAQRQQFVITALIFTIVGTLLGGVWADQSWGRFWGWDPKENGALLIVLWVIWLIHGNMSGHIQSTYYLAGLAFLSVIVALSWFGVNLLSVGLHSYGFIEGIALGLFMFCFLETVIIAGLVYRAKTQSLE